MRKKIKYTNKPLGKLRVVPDFLPPAERLVYRTKNVGAVEVGSVSKRGFWLLVSGQEYFLPFKQFPWFEHAPIGQLLNVQLHHSRHLYWPDLDIDLSLESIEHPERFPLVSRVRTFSATKSKTRQQRSVSAPRRTRHARHG